MKRKLIITISLAFNCICIFAQTNILMSNSGSYSVCSGNFYDGGGPMNDYGTSLNVVVTLHPLDSTSKLSVKFTSFHIYENYDFLYVYNGADTNALRIATLTGQSGYGTITSSAPHGSLTFKFPTYYFCLASLLTR